MTRTIRRWSALAVLSLTLFQSANCVPMAERIFINGVVNTLLFEIVDRVEFEIP